VGRAPGIADAVRPNNVDFADHGGSRRVTVPRCVTLR
jgi:hypothetical protein